MHFWLDICRGLKRKELIFPKWIVLFFNSELSWKIWSLKKWKNKI